MVVLLFGVAIFGLSLLFLPLVLIKPYKFCALNCLGTFTIFCSIIIMWGKIIIRKLFSKEKLIFILLFMITFVLEIYYSLFNTSYILVLICALLHFISILYITLSFIPYGV